MRTWQYSALLFFSILLSCSTRLFASTLISNVTSSASAEFSADDDDQVIPPATTGLNLGSLSAAISGASTAGNTLALANAGLAIELNSASSVRVYGSAYASASAALGDPSPHGYAHGEASIEFDALLSEPTNVDFLGDMLIDLHPGDGGTAPPFHSAEKATYRLSVEAPDQSMWGVALSYTNDPVVPFATGWFPLPLESGLYHFTCSFDAIAETSTPGDFGSALASYDLKIAFSPAPEPGPMLQSLTVIVLLLGRRK
jgi:hypothetical protein